MRRLAQFLNEALSHCKIESDQAILKSIVHKQLERCPAFEARQAFVDDLDAHVDDWVRSSDEMQQFLYKTDISKLSPACQKNVQELVLGLGEVISLLVRWQSRCEMKQATQDLNKALKNMQEAGMPDDFTEHQNAIVDLFTKWRTAICKQLGDSGVQAWTEIADKVEEIVRTLESQHACDMNDTTLLKSMLKKLLSRCPYPEIKARFAHLQ